MRIFGRQGGQGLLENGLYGTRRNKKDSSRSTAHGRRRLSLEPLEQRALLTVTLAPIVGPDTGSAYDVPSGKTLFVPLTGTDAGQTISYTASSNNSNVSATVLTGNPELIINVTGTTASGQSFSGAMTFQLFQNLAPNTVGIIENLVNSGFYTDLSFYRIVPGFVIQGGANNTKTATTFDDEINQQLSFNSPGILAMANSGPNTNSSEIFVSDIGLPLSQTPQYLNYNYTAFGQLTSGFDIYNDIMEAKGVTSTNSSPTSPVTITSASIKSSDTQNGVLMITEPNNYTGTATITVTATGTDSTTAQQSFAVDAAPATTPSDQQPVILNSVTNQTTGTGTPVSFQVSADLISTGTPTFTVTGDSTFNASLSNVSVTVTPGSSNNATVTLTPAAGFSGTINLIAHVTDAINGTTYQDAEPLTLTVFGPIAVTSVPTTINAAGESDVTVSGTGTAGDTISVIANDGTHVTPAVTATVGSNGTWTVTNLNVTTLNDGPITYTASDTSGNTTTTSTNTSPSTKATTPPTVTSIVPADANPSGAASVDFTVTFSEAVTGVTAADFSVNASAGISGAAVTAVTGSGTTYTVSVSTGTGSSGTLGITLTDNDTIIDAAGNPLGGAGAGNGNFTSTTYSIVKAPEVESISKADTDPAQGTTVDFTVTFTEDVTGVAATDFVAVPSSGITGASVTGVSGSGSVYTVTVNTGSGNGTLGLNLVDNDSIVDSGGTPLGGTGDGNGNFTGPTYNVIKFPVALSISPSGSATTNAASVTYTVTFNESVTGVVAGDFTVAPSSGITGASVTSLSGSGSVYTVTVNTGSGDGTLGLNLTDDDTIVDSNNVPLGGVGTGNGDFTGGTVAVVKTPVVITSSPTAISLTNETSLSISGTSGDNVQITLTATDGTNSITPLTTTSDANGNWSFSNVNVSSLSDGNIVFTATDAAGNTVSTGNIPKDATAPTVLSIVLGSANPTKAASVTYTVTFSEAVTNVQASDFSLAIGSGLSGSTISGITGSGSTYTVTVASGTGSGTLGLNLVDDDSIIDAAGNPLGGIGSGNGDFTGSVYTIDNTAVAFTNLPASVNNATQSSLTITGTADPGVTVTLTASDGTNTSTSVQTTTSASGVFTFTNYSVQSLNDGSITFTATDAAGNTVTSASVTKDTVLPAIAVTTVTTPINSENETSTSAGGTGAVGATISVVATDGTNSTAAMTTTVGSGGTWSVSGIDVSSLNDGTITYTATATDSFGNTASNSLTTTKATDNASLSGTVFIDANGNHVLNSGEAVVPGAYLVLSGTDANGNSLPMRTAVSGSNGAYSFTQLPAGNYTLTEILPTKLSSATGTVGNSGGNVAGNVIANINITDGASSTGYNFSSGGLASTQVSLNLFLASTPPVEELFTNAVASSNTPTPLATSISRASTDPTAGAATVQYNVTFNESVNNVVATDFTTVPSSGISGSTVTGVTGSGNSYVVTVNTGSGTGTLGLDLFDNDSITNAAGVPLGGVGEDNGDFIGPSYDVTAAASAASQQAVDAALASQSDWS